MEWQVWMFTIIDGNVLFSLGHQVRHASPPISRNNNNGIAYPSRHVSNKVRFFFVLHLNTEDQRLKIDLPVQIKFPCIHATVKLVVSALYKNNENRKGYYSTS